MIVNGLTKTLLSIKNYYFVEIIEIENKNSLLVFIK